MQEFPKNSYWNGELILGNRKGTPKVGKRTYSTSASAVVEKKLKRNKNQI